jgi:hypothetical protein
VRTTLSMMKEPFGGTWQSTADVNQELEILAACRTSGWWRTSLMESFSCSFSMTNPEHISAFERRLHQR